jgi:hypothetical protein
VKNVMFGEDLRFRKNSDHGLLEKDIASIE